VLRREQQHHPFASSTTGRPLLASPMCVHRKRIALFFVPQRRGWETLGIFHPPLWPLGHRRLCVPSPDTPRTLRSPFRPPARTHPHPFFILFAVFPLQRTGPFGPAELLYGWVSHLCASRSFPLCAIFPLVCNPTTSSCDGKLPQLVFVGFFSCTTPAGVHQSSRVVAPAFLLLTPPDLRPDPLVGRAASLLAPNRCTRPSSWSSSSASCTR